MVKRKTYIGTHLLHTSDRIPSLQQIALDKLYSSGLSSATIKNFQRRKVNLKHGIGRDLLIHRRQQKKKEIGRILQSSRRLYRHRFLPPGSLSHRHHNALSMTGNFDDDF